MFLNSVALQLVSQMTYGRHFLWFALIYLKQHTSKQKSDILRTRAYDWYRFHICIKNYCSACSKHAVRHRFPLSEMSKVPNLTLLVVAVQHQHVGPKQTGAPLPSHRQGIKFPFCGPYQWRCKYIIQVRGCTYYYHCFWSKVLPSNSKHGSLSARTSTDRNVKSHLQFS